MNSEIKLITTLQEDNKELRTKNTELKKQIESYEKKKMFWSFTFSIRNIFK
jgi:cell division septum initiation protein DivIVA